MATFKLRANELTGETGLSVYLYPVGGTIANSGGDTLTESSGLFTATVAESLSGLHDYFIYQGGLSIYRGLVFCSGSTWIADDFSWVTSKTDALPSDPADQSVLAGLLSGISAQTDLIGTATILPLTGTVSAVANASHISIKTNEAVVVTVGLTNSSGTAVSTVGMTLELVFESGATEVVIANADITKSSTGFSFTVTTALNASEKLWTYVCRKTTDEAVLCNGKLEVIYAPNN